MRLFSWLSSIQSSLNRAGARRSRRSFAQMERLEDRIVPAVLLLVDVTGLLTVTAAPGDVITITANGGSSGDVIVNINGTDNQAVVAVLGDTDPSDITGILVLCDVGGNVSI